MDQGSMIVPEGYEEEPRPRLIGAEPETSPRPKPGPRDVRPEQPSAQHGPSNDRLGELERGFDTAAGASVHLVGFEDRPDLLEWIGSRAARMSPWFPRWAWTVYFIMRSEPAADMEPSVSAWCEVDIPYGRLTVCLSPTFWPMTDEERERALVHELGHGLAGELEHVAENLMNNQGSDDARALAQADVFRARERTAEGLAVILAPMIFPTGWIEASKLPDV